VRVQTGAVRPGNSSSSGDRSDGSSDYATDDVDIATSAHLTITMLKTHIIASRMRKSPAREECPQIMSHWFPTWPG